MNDRLARSAAVCFAVLGATALAAGCSAASGGEETTATATSGALTVIDPALAAAANVSAGQVTFPASSMAALATHQPGDVIVSPRVVGSAGNTSGFLRKVKSTSMQDGRVVMVTEPAAVSDVVSEGKAKPEINLPASWTLLDIGETQIADLSESLGSIDSSLASNTLSIDAKLDGAHVVLKPDLDFTMGFKDFSLDSAHLGASGTLDATLGAEVDVKVTGTLGKDGLAALEGYTVKVEKRLWTSEEYNLPTVYIGIIPIETSVQMFLNAVCWVGFKGFKGGELSFKASADATATIDGAVDYANGNWTTSDGAKIDGTGSVTINDKVSENAICQVGPSFALKFYDAVGPELGITAGANVTSGSASWNARSDIRAWVQGDVSVLGYNKVFGPYSLYDYAGPVFASSSN
jgi:hypothetical protein